MQKLIKNWIFTLIVCILLVIPAVLMFLDGFDVGGIRFGTRLIHLLVAIALTLYVIFVLFPLFWRRKGILRLFSFFEIVLLLLSAAAQLCMEWFRIPVLSSLQVCSMLGFVLWLRGVVETIHAYLSAAEEDPSARTPLWKLLLYILLSAVGIWQLVAPTISDRSFIFVVAIAATVMATVFACLTFSNRKASEAARKAKKAEKLANEQAQQAAAVAQEEAAQAEEMPLPQEEEEEPTLLPEGVTEE